MRRMVDTSSPAFMKEGFFNVRVTTNSGNSPPMLCCILTLSQLTTSTNLSTNL